MELLLDPKSWLSFLTLAVLEVVLGIDNIIFLLILVERLPLAQRRQGRILGLAFAMLTRIGLLLSVTWIASMRQPLATVAGLAITGRGLILFCGGVVLTTKPVLLAVGLAVAALASLAFAFSRVRAVRTV